jgi:hypothetical protein
MCHRVGDRIPVHLGTGRTHILHLVCGPEACWSHHGKACILGLMLVHLDTTGADLLSQAMVREAVADYAAGIVQAEVGQLVELSEAIARTAGDDCAVEIGLSSADHVDWVSVAASLDLAEEGRLAEGVYLVVLSARLVQVLGRLAEGGGAAQGDHLLGLSARHVQVLVWVVARVGGPIQVGLGVAVCHAGLLGPIAGVLQAWPLSDCSVWVVLDGIQLPVLESNLVQRTELKLSVDHQLGGALVILVTFQTVPSMVALVTCTPHPGCVHGARAGPARLASGALSTVCQRPATPQLLRPALLPGTCCVGGNLVC